MGSPFDASTPATRTVARRLIAATRERSAEFPHVLANHLPMVLAILTRLGASPTRLAAYAERYDDTNRVPPLAPRKAPIHADDWHVFLGDRAREADFRRFFDDEAERLGGAEAIRRYVPRLARGVGASALHPLMRLAYGVIGADDAEIGTALGYWAATFLPLPVLPVAPDATDDPLAALLAMRHEASFREIRAESDLLWHWIRAVGTTDALTHAAACFAAGPDALDRVGEASLALYAGTMSFEALHALTGTHWLRQVLPFLDDPAPLLRHFWQVIMAVYPKIGMPEPVAASTLDTWRGIAPPDDREIAEAAVRSDDEHDPSLVFSSLQEFARTGDALYRIVAARRVGLLPS